MSPRKRDLEHSFLVSPNNFYRDALVPSLPRNTLYRYLPARRDDKNLTREPVGKNPPKARLAKRVDAPRHLGDPPSEPYSTSSRIGGKDNQSRSGVSESSIRPWVSLMETVFEHQLCVCPR